MCLLPRRDSCHMSKYSEFWTRSSRSIVFVVSFKEVSLKDVGTTDPEEEFNHSALLFSQWSLG